MEAQTPTTQPKKQNEQNSPTQKKKGKTKTKTFQNKPRNTKTKISTLAPNTSPATHRPASEAPIVTFVQRVAPLVIVAVDPAATIAAAAHPHAPTVTASIPTASHSLAHAPTLAKASHAVAVVTSDARHAAAVREQAANHATARAAKRAVGVARRTDHASEDAPDPAANSLARAHTFAATLRAIFVVAASDSAALRTGVAVFVQGDRVLRRFFVRQKVQIRVVVFCFFVGRLRSRIFLLAVFLLVNEHS